MSGFTKGDWSFRPHKANKMLVGSIMCEATTGNKFSVAEIVRLDNDESEANARLIAAAPKLLGALKKVQIALADWRDGKDETEGLNLEEVKYMIVDTVIAEVEKGN